MSYTLVIENFLPAKKVGDYYYEIDGIDMSVPDRAIKWCRNNLSPTCYHLAGTGYIQTRICFRHEHDLLHLLLSVDLTRFSVIPEEF